MPAKKKVDAEPTAKYSVKRALRHNGKHYAPDTENNVVELTDSEAKTLADLGVIGGVIREEE